MTLKGGLPITSISYFPDGKRMISGSSNEIVRKWDLQEGKEIKEAQIVCEEDVNAMAVSRDGRWVVTGGGESGRVELKACKVDKAIVTTFEGHSGPITCVDISLDSTLLASGSWDVTARIWSLKTGKLEAGPFRSVDWVGAVRLSTDSKKLAVKSWSGRWLEVWDVKTEMLAVRAGQYGGPASTHAPVFWTNKNKNILTTLINSDVTRISEFDASTLKIIGAPFAGHTEAVTNLALSFDGALLASASSHDNTIKLWAFESRQLLASFDVQKPTCIVLSPNSRQLAYTTSSKGDHKIYICNTAPEILASVGPVPEGRQTSSKTNPTFERLLESDATRRRRNLATSPAISFPPRLQKPLPTTESQRPTFLLHLRRFLRFSPSTNAVPPVQHGQPRDPLDFPATSPLPPRRSLSAQATTHPDDFEMSSQPRTSDGVTQFLRHLSSRISRPNHGPPVFEVAAGRKVTRLAAANLPEYRKVDDTRHPSRQPVVPQDAESSDIDSLPDVHWFKAFLCYYSCLSHGRLRMPPRWRLERVDIPRQNGATGA
ncbi:WD40-repeat-containing domain protein [Suillus discolor]|uniref:WD40-repeat-containing domain protein n=1 Tax=Suillus discolor TaxID=1912936 RepID=A0A9P7JSG2_9AGAM|nr:WD40-repeat-containing domain protein [Suillus discolor]KAG2105036.1 WD40-repeat-containing domain protein [Suillus discolor]